MNLDLRVFTLPAILLVTFNVALSIFDRPIWSAVFAAVLLLYRTWLFRARRPMPPRLLQWAVQISIGVAVWQHYGTILGDEAAGTLIMLLTCLKTLELRSQRDYFVLALLCILVLMSTLLLNQSLALTIFLLIDVAAILSYLYALEAGTWNWRWKEVLWPGFAVLLKSAPIVIIFFLLFPRFSTGFGTGQQTGAKTGINDELRPGSVARLVASDELVFRATFLDGSLPPRRLIYFRGAVLTVGQGLEWSRPKDPRPSRPPVSAGAEGQIEIYLEPGFERYIFTTDMTRSVYFPNEDIGRGVRLRHGRTFELQQPLATRERYFLQFEDSIPQEDVDEARDTLLGQRPSKKMQDFLRGYQGLKDVEVISRLLNHFSNAGFKYSLQPPPAESMDQFFFDHKTGFCEHYAATMATLLRALKIPARVVVGFQGGSPSFLENYITVRGYDAHAWVEYYDRYAKRWRRVDPTAQVNAERLIQGGQSYLNQSSSWLTAWAPKEIWATYLRTRALIDEVDASWTGFLLRFDLAKQKELLARMGMEGVLFRALWVFLILALCLILALLYFVEARSREKLTREERLYRRFRKMLWSLRLIQGENEGLATIQTRVAQHDPQLFSELQPLFEIFVRTRYAGQIADKAEWNSISKRLNPWSIRHWLPK